jgi:Leucine-rich repeat (LRR) protein
MQYLSGMTNMVAISFQDCGVTDQSFTALSGMTKLKEFDIFRTRVGNDALGAIAGAKEMSKMKLRDCAITTKGIVEHIGKFPNLTALDLSETTIKDAALVEIGKLAKLEDLNLWHTRVTDAGLSALTSSKLKRLNLDDTNIGDGAIEHLSKIESLEFLHIGKTAVTDDKIGELAKLKNLKDLILTNTTLSKKAVAQLQEKLPKTSIKY